MLPYEGSLSQLVHSLSDDNDIYFCYLVMAHRNPTVTVAVVSSVVTILIVLIIAVIILIVRRYVELTV